MSFQPDNPPNAALVVSTTADDRDFAVVELLNPTYDAATKTAIYDIKLLRHYEQALGMSFAESPTDPASLPARFGAAHLLIDDCADGTITCTSNDKQYPCPNGDVCGSFPNEGYCYNFPQCIPCRPYYHNHPPAGKLYQWWIDLCNNTFPDCRAGGREHVGCYPDM